MNLDCRPDDLAGEILMFEFHRTPFLLPSSAVSEALYCRPHRAHWDRRVRLPTRLVLPETLRNAGKQERLRPSVVEER